MADLNNMAENIKTILKAVPGIKEAFDYEPQNMSILPAATLFFDGFAQTDQTTKRNSVGWQWAIRLYVPIRISDIKVPQLELRTLMNDTLKQFRMNLNLGGSCLWHTISSGEVFALLEQNNPMLVAEINLVATTEEY